MSKKQSSKPKFLQGPLSDDAWDGIAAVVIILTVVAGVSIWLQGL